MTRHKLLTEAELEMLAEIDNLLDEAHKHVLEFGEGLGKSGDGYFDVSFGNHFDRDGERRYTPRILIYAYTLGPSRNHYFDSIEEALAAVREWHSTEMAINYDEEDF